jgi:arsenite methyltransferase
MASTCPVDLDTLRLRAEIESIYRRVATEPGGDFHFHRGPTYATEMLGYDAASLARLPADSTASFAGVGFDCFRGTSKERVAMKYGVVGVNVYAHKPR